MPAGMTPKEFLQRPLVPLCTKVCAPPSQKMPLSGVALPRFTTCNRTITVSL